MFAAVALAAVLMIAADSQALPRAELDEAIKANRERQLAELALKLAEAKRATALAVKLPAAERREAAATVRANVAAIEKEIAAAKKAGGMVPHIGYKNIDVGQVGKLYDSGHVLGPFTTQPDGEIRGKGDTWYDLPVTARVWEIVDATTLHAEYKGVSFKVKTDTAGVKEDDKLRLDAPLKVVAVDRAKPDDPVWEIRFFAK